MAEIKITQQMINEYRAVTGNYVLTDSAIAEKIKNEPLPEGFNLLAFDAYKAGSTASSSNLFGYGFGADSNIGLSFERTTPKINPNEQQAKKIASSVKENSRWYKDWSGSSLVAECKKITKENILYTLKEFEKISPDKNLVLTITDNSTIPVEKQKNALKHIFNVLCDLAKDKGVDTTHFEKAFKTNISQTRTETRVSSTGIPSGTYTKEVLTDSNITTINNIIVGLRNSIEVKANPNVYNQIALALTPEEQIQERTIGSLKYKHSSSLEALENQNRYDGWAGELADWMSGAWGSKNREKHVRADLETFSKQIAELEEAKKVSGEAFEKKFEEIFGIKYDAKLIVNYQQVEQLYQIATSCYQLEQFFKTDLNVLLSNSTLREETKTVSIDPMTSQTQTTVLATKEQVFEREFNKLANFVGQGNLENGKQQLKDVFKASGLTETSTLQEKYTVLRQVAQNYAKALHDNTMHVTGNKGYYAIAKDFDDAYKSAFGVTNDIARRIAEYNVSQQAGAGVIKTAIMIGGTIALGAITGGVGLPFFPALTLTSVGAGAITATTEFSDRLSSGYVIEGFKENGIEGAIDGAKQALPDEEIIRILKSSGITTLAVATGGILGAGVEIGAQTLNMSILTKTLAHIVVGAGVGAAAEYLHTGTVSVGGVVFAFVLSAIGQVIAITKVGMMDNGKVTFDKQTIKQARQDLGLADDVVLTEEVLKKAYRKMSIQTHPDKGGTAEAFVKVKTAYDLLLQYTHPTTVTGAKTSSSQASESATSSSLETRVNSSFKSPKGVVPGVDRDFEIVKTENPALAVADKIRAKWISELKLDNNTDNNFARPPFKAFSIKDEVPSLILSGKLQERLTEYYKTIANELTNIAERNKDTISKLAQDYCDDKQVFLEQVLKLFAKDFGMEGYEPNIKILGTMDDSCYANWQTGYIEFSDVYRDTNDIVELLAHEFLHFIQYRDILVNYGKQGVKEMVMNDSRNSLQQKKEIIKRVLSSPFTKKILKTYVTTKENPGTIKAYINAIYKTEFANPVKINVDKIGHLNQIIEREAYSGSVRLGKENPDIVQKTIDRKPRKNESVPEDVAAILKGLGILPQGRGRLDISSDIFDSNKIKDIFKTIGFSEQAGRNGVFANKELAEQVIDFLGLTRVDEIYFTDSDFQDISKMLKYGNNKDFWQNLTDVEFVAYCMKFKDMFNEFYHLTNDKYIIDESTWNQMILDIQNIKITDSQKSALNDFIGDGYGNINIALTDIKRGKSISTVQEQKIENLSLLIEQHPIPEDITLMRVERNESRFSNVKLKDGTTLTEALEIVAADKSKLEEINAQIQGLIIENERFMSATLRDEKLPMSGMPIKLNLKKGTKALYRNTYISVSSGEHEYIIQKDSKMIVKGIELDWKGNPFFVFDVITG